MLKTLLTIALFMRNAKDRMKNPRLAFTLWELLIVVGIIGILAAIVLPLFQDHIAKAKSSAAKDSLRLLRDAIEIYAIQNNDVPPGYPSNDRSNTPLSIVFYTQLILDGHYLSERPENPFNGQITTKTITDAEEFPAEPNETDTYGWIYKPATKTIKLNWPGTDSEGVSYFDY